MKKLLATFLLAVASSQASAFCFKEAADRYKVDEALLRAIAKTENAAFNPNLVIKSEDGWEFMGLMMVSSIWLPELKKFGIDRQRLLDPCVNVNVGAWVLADAIHRFGFTWKAVGAYNTGKYSKDLAAQQRYVRNVWKNFNQERR
ncbi:lytic transglycosylase domain-containing protein [Ralstonia pseudosolanacearum]|uniref:lytic transglycosylase domain-containing protein n=1 Tax=Ralstonia pseudosolanacearum TaxID=1310165 RepID=UPI003CF7B47B